MILAVIALAWLLINTLATLIIIMNVVVDILYKIVDPRIKLK